MNNRIVEIFLEVAAIEGLSGRERQVADYIKNFLTHLNIPYYEDNTHLLNGGNSGNIICKIGNGGDSIFLSHMDTARSTLNVKPIIKENKISSDGTTVLGVDNRAGIAVLLYILEKLISEKKTINPCTIAFTVCEETTLAGSKSLSLNGNIKKGFVFDSMLRPGNFITNASGAKEFLITVYGKASHAGIEPEKGINAIEVASHAISKMKIGRIDNSTTINIASVNGGSGLNVVPDKIIIKGEIRSLDETKVEYILQNLIDVFDKTTKEFNTRFEFQSHWDFKPYIINQNEQVYIDIVDAIEKAGLEPVDSYSLGGSDANSLNEKGIPTVNIGIGAQNPHSNDEFIFIEDLEKSAAIAAALLTNGK